MIHPATGLVARGPEGRLGKVRLDAKLYRQAERMLDEVKRLRAGGEPPRLTLNGHCPVCEFRQRCRRQAEEADDISLLGGVGVAVVASRLKPRRAELQMKRPLPRTPAQWHEEIKLAIADAAEAAPFGPLVGTAITPANLFHLAPVVCLKFRGKKVIGREADRVTKVALANYVANSDPDGVDHGLEQRPLMAFTLCYVAAHLALDLVDEQEAEAILTYCEEHL